MTKPNDFKYTDERFADLQLLRYRLDGFEKLTLRQKLYVYYLAKAALAGRDITMDQNGRHNLSIRRLLEAAYEHYEGDRHTDQFKAMTIYLKRLWFSNGIHHHYGCEKFVPAFDERWFRQVVLGLDERALRETQAERKALLDELCPVIFDPSVMPKRVNQADGDDLVRTSACNFYDGVTQEEAERYYAQKRDAALGDCQPCLLYTSPSPRDRG